MRTFPNHRGSVLLLTLGLAGLLLGPARALEKGGMPDLAQEEQTCLPTSTANLIIWFGHHGYPKLIRSGDTEEERDLHTLHGLMTDTSARYDLGTRTEAVTLGIEKYIRDAGYDCDVEYRGLDWNQAHFPQIVKDEEDALYRVQSNKPPLAFTRDWLEENDDPNKGFILLLAFVRYDSNHNRFSDVIHAGHAVTLVNAGRNFVLVHDPAHHVDDTGRKNVTPEILNGGTFQMSGYQAPVTGLMLLNGLLERMPPDVGVLLTGAVCITMHPDHKPGTVIASAAGSPNAVIGGEKAVPPSAAKSGSPATPAPSRNDSWATQLFDYFFSK